MKREEITKALSEHLTKKFQGMDNDPHLNLKMSIESAIFITEMGKTGTITEAQANHLLEKLKTLGWDENINGAKLIQFAEESAVITKLDPDTWQNFVFQAKVFASDNPHASFYLRRVLCILDNICEKLGAITCKKIRQDLEVAGQPLVAEEQLRMEYGLDFAPVGAALTILGDLERSISSAAGNSPQEQSGTSSETLEKGP